MKTDIIVWWIKTLPW